MNEPIFDLCKFTLSNGQTFEVQVHYRNVDTPLVPSPVAYIETYDIAVPTVKNVHLYHSWKELDGGKLTAWYIPESEIKSIEKVS